MTTQSSILMTCERVRALRIREADAQKGLSNQRFHQTNLGCESYALSEAARGLGLQLMRKHVRPASVKGAWGLSLDCGELVLQATGGALRLERENPGWWRVWLVAPVGSSIRMGADSLETIARRLVSHLRSDDLPSAGSFNGHEVHYVFGMMDPLCAVYSFRDGDDLVLVCQAHDLTELEPRLVLSPSLSRDWTDQLQRYAESIAGQDAV